MMFEVWLCGMMCIEDNCELSDKQNFILIVATLCTCNCNICFFRNISQMYFVPCRPSLRRVLVRRNKFNDKMFSKTCINKVDKDDSFS